MTLHKIKEEYLISSLIAYRNTLNPEKIKQEGEQYWKNEVLSMHSALMGIGMKWSSIYDDETITAGLDSGVSMLELAEVLVKNFKEPTTK